MGWKHYEICISDRVGISQISYSCQKVNPILSVQLDHDHPSNLFNARFSERDFLVLRLHIRQLSTAKQLLVVRRSKRFKRKI